MFLCNDKYRRLECHFNILFTGVLDVFTGELDLFTGELDLFTGELDLCNRNVTGFKKVIPVFSQDGAI